MAIEVQVPKVPCHAGVPEGVKNRWRDEYRKAYTQSMQDTSGDEQASRQTATKEANRVFRVSAPESHADAVKLAPWQVAHRSERDGNLHVVTIDGRKHKFAIPAQPAKPASDGAANGGTTGGGATN
jgi:hypothetical protein